MPGRVVDRHHRQSQLDNPLFGHWQTDQSAPVGGHKVDGGRIGKLRRDHQIALVLAVLVIHQDKHAPLTGLFDDVFDGGNCRCQFSFNRAGRFKLHRAFLLYQVIWHISHHHPVCQSTHTHAPVSFCQINSIPQRHLRAHACVRPLPRNTAPLQDSPQPDLQPTNPAPSRYRR